MNNTIVYISGELNFVTVPVLNKNNRAVILKNQNTIFDLSQVSSGDNTGVGLFVALASFAKSMQKEISFIKLPQQLLDLIEAVGIKEILPTISL